MCSQCLIPVFDRIVDVTLYNTVYYYNTLYIYIYVTFIMLLCCHLFQYYILCDRLQVRKT